MEYIVKQE
jgi:hypothetical protein